MLGVKGFDAVFAEPSRDVAVEARRLGFLYVPVVWVPLADASSLGVVDAWGSCGLFAFNNSGCLMNSRVLEGCLRRIERAICETGSDAMKALAP